MADHIPFVYTEEDCSILREHYSDSVAIRLALETIDRTFPLLPRGPQRWMDAGVDGLEKWPKWERSVSSSYKRHIGRFDGYERIGDPEFQKRPDKVIVSAFVGAVLQESVRRFQPEWLSVPQLPMVHDSSRNKINQLLASATREWKTRNGYRGRLILPLIFTHQRQVNLKTNRNKKIEQARKCYELAGADGIWSVDSSLSDQEGSQTLERIRFKGLVNLQMEMNEVLPPDIISIGGPYWGMNLVLWARRLTRFPAIGLGGSFQYYLPGGKLKRASVRVALPPLRRTAVAVGQLQSWLRTSLTCLSEVDEAHRQFLEVSSNFHRYSRDTSSGREQVAIFYKRWFDAIAAVRPEGRALALYQDLSSAYVVGKALTELPETEKTARRPERVAKQLMLHCL